MDIRFVEMFEHRTFRGARILTAASLGYRPVVFVQDNETGTVYLPVEKGRGFEVVVTNDTPVIVAFPARIGNGTDWTNVYRACQTVDPAFMPSDGGMWETRPGDKQIFDSFQLPHGRKEPFVIAPSGASIGEDDSLNTFEVYYRTPKTPVTAIANPTYTLPPGATARGSRSAGSFESDVTVATGTVQQGSRIITGLGYETKATRLVAARLVSRAWMATELAEHDINLSPTTGEDWEPRAIQRNYGDLYTRFAPSAS